jgi:hypothetical protein
VRGTLRVGMKRRNLVSFQMLERLRKKKRTFLPDLETLRRREV